MAADNARPLKAVTDTGLEMLASHGGRTGVTMLDLVVVKSDCTSVVLQAQHEQGRHRRAG